MPKAYSVDLRERVIEAVETGASRREAAERFEVSVSSAVKWLQGWREKRSAAPKLRGGSISPLEEFATEILALVGEQPDRTLVETVATLRKRRIKPAAARSGGFLTDTTSPSKKPSRTAAACGRRNGRGLSSWLEGSGRRLFGGRLPRKKTWSMGCCARESGDAVRRSRLGN
jgi:transposase